MNTSQPRATMALLVLLAPLLPAAPAGAEELLAPRGSVWRFHDGGRDLGAAWRDPGYDDAGWQTGPAGLGYGHIGLEPEDNDPPGSTEPVVTRLDFGPDPQHKHPCTYLRLAFDLDRAVAAAELRVRADDGFVAYLDGREVARWNMPAGSTGYTTLASQAVELVEENAWQSFAIDPARLRPGRNLLAIEVHQHHPASEDLLLDAEIAATPAVAEPVWPPPGATAGFGPTRLRCRVADPLGVATAALLLGPAEQQVQLLRIDDPARLHDVELSAEYPTANHGDEPELRVDAQPRHHVLIKIDDLVGDGPGRIPADARLIAAELLLSVSDGGDALRLRRLRLPWDEHSATWQQRLGNLPWPEPGGDGPGCHHSQTWRRPAPAGGIVALDVTAAVQRWLDGEPNHGLLLTGGRDGVFFAASESDAGPALELTFETGFAAVAEQDVGAPAAEVAFTPELADGAGYRWSCRLTNQRGLLRRAPVWHALAMDRRAPAAPAAPQPADGAGGVAHQALLAATVEAPGDGPLQVTFRGRPRPPAPFTVVALPDTQFYSDRYPEIFTRQTQWIAARAAELPIVFVSHLGDVVQQWNIDQQWRRADTSMSLLDGVVPYAIAPGNHDQQYQEGVNSGVFPLFNETFPYQRFLEQLWYRGHFPADANDNSAQVLELGPLRLLFVHLEFCPDAASRDWALEVLQAHPDHLAVLTTHGYINREGRRSVWHCPFDGDVENRLEKLWQEVIAPSPNLRLVLCGHVHGEHSRIDTAGGRRVYQLLSDYQQLGPNGGNGYLRRLRFLPRAAKIEVRTYSPWLADQRSGEKSRFDLDLELAPFRALGTVTGVAAGGRAELRWPGLAPRTGYEWFVEVRDAAGRSRRGRLWSFTTGADPNPLDGGGDDGAADGGCDGDAGGPDGGDGSPGDGGPSGGGDDGAGDAGPQSGDDPAAQPAAADSGGCGCGPVGGAGGSGTAGPAWLAWLLPLVRRRLRSDRRKC